MPRPRSRSRAPFCVPAGIESCAVVPRRVGTWTVPPAIAVASGVATRTARSLPVRVKIGMRPDVHPDEEVAPRTAVSAGAALPRRAHPGAVVDARRDLHLDSAWPVRRAHVDCQRRAGVRLLEPDLGVAFDVRPAPGHPAPSATGGRHIRLATEELLEEVAERRAVAEHPLELLGGHGPVAELIAAAEGVRSRLAGPLPLLVLLPARTELVVLLALLGIAEDLVGLVDLLELVLGRLVALVHIGVMCAGDLLILAPALKQRRQGPVRSRVVRVFLHCLPVELLGLLILAPALKQRTQEPLSLPVIRVTRHGLPSQLLGLLKRPSHRKQRHQGHQCIHIGRVFVYGLPVELLGAVEVA